MKKINAPVLSASTKIPETLVFSTCADNSTRKNSKNGQNLLVIFFFFFFFLYWLFVWWLFFWRKHNFWRKLIIGRHFFVRTKHLARHVFLFLKKNLPREKSLAKKSLWTTIFLDIFFGGRGFQPISYCFEPLFV